MNGLWFVFFSAQPVVKRVSANTRKIGILVVCAFQAFSVHPRLQHDILSQIFCVVASKAARMGIPDNKFCIALQIWHHVIPFFFLKSFSLY
jgi:hypothetical protein